MNKKIITSEALQGPLKEGLDKIANIVKKTLGPGGRVIFLQRDGQALDGSPLSPILTKDGVSVAMQCGDKNPEVDLVIQTVKNMCKRTNKDVGDGPQPLYSKVLTPKGFVSMKDLEVGSKICGTNETIQTVLGVFPKGQKDIVKVTFSDKRVVECCPEHLWTTNNGKTLTTKEMLKNFLKITPKQDKNFKYYVKPTVVSFNQNNSEMPLDPYLVGALLGDGSLSGTGSIELSLGFNKKHSIDKIKLPEGFDFTSTWIESKNYFRIKLKGQDKKGNSIYRILESLGLLGVKSETKFIPKSYLYSSVETRKALLQGLLDTDAHFNKRGLFEFSTISNELKDDFLILTRSLGLTCHYYLKEKKESENSYSLTPIHRISQLKGFKKGLKIINMEVTGKQTEMQCIKVSNSDHLYITDDFVPTHNTTSSIILGQAIYHETIDKLDENFSLNPQLLKEALDLKVTKILEDLTKIAKPVDNYDDIKNVAKISANGDEQISAAIADAFQAVGAEGVVTVDEGSGSGVKVNVVDGYQFQKGAQLRDAFFNSKNMTHFEAEEPEEGVRIVIYDGKLVTHTQILPILMKLAEASGAESDNKKIPPIVIMANEFSVDVIQWLIIQKQQIGFQVCCVEGPHVTHVRTGYYDDLAVYTGGSRMGNGNRSLDNMNLDDVGLVKRVLIDKYKTTLYDGFGAEDEVLIRVDQLKEMKNQAESPYDAQVISDRIAILTHGIAKIEVGGFSDIEIKEKYDRVEDALNAARAAIEEGVVQGGGVALLKIATQLQRELDSEENKEEYSRFASQILINALQYPLRQILDNIGMELTQEMLDKLQETGVVYDARHKKFCNYIEAGIIDPVKVTKAALQNAMSVAGLLITAGGAVIYNLDK